MITNFLHSVVVLPSAALIIGVVAIIVILMARFFILKRRFAVSALPDKISSDASDKTVTTDKRDRWNMLSGELAAMYKQLIENERSGIYIADVEGNLFFANPALIKMLGFDAKTDIKNMNINDCFSDVNRNKNKFLEVLKQNDEVSSYKFKHVKLDGSTVILSATGNYIYSDEGEAFSIQGVVQDITEKANLEELLIVKHKMELMLEFFEKIDMIREYDVLVHYILGGAADILGANRCSLMLLDEDNMTLTIEGAKGLPQEYAKDTKMNLGDPICGLITLERRPLLVKDIDKDERFKKYKKQTGYWGHSFMIAPLEYHNELVGVLNVGEKQSEFKHGQPFNEIDLKILTHIAVKIASAIQNIKMLDELNVLTNTDPVTNIYNYRLLSESLDREMRSYKRHKNDLYIFMMDLDDFKSYNDTFGHTAGDELLRDLGMILKSNLRETDIVCRYAGDEFCVVLPNTDLSGVMNVTNKVIKSVAEFPFKRKVTISIGVTKYMEAMTKKDFIAEADQALYKAKKSGKNQAFISGFAFKT